MNGLLDISFAEVARIHLLWPVALIIMALGWLERRGEAGMDAVLSPTMQARLVVGPARNQRRWRLALLTLAMVAAVFALMRPQAAAQPTTEAIAAHSADVMIVLDVSKSMLAEDVTPNRLTRAKADIARLATRLAGARLGLVVFAGRAAVACPLTIDDAFFRFVLRDVDTNSVARGGTRIGEALRVATKAFPPGLGAKLVVLITDGEDQDSYPLEAAKEAAAAGVRVIAVGLGSEEGSQIVMTDATTGAKTVMLHDGVPVISRIDGKMLQQLAEATNGAFVPAKTAAIDLESIVSEHVVPMLRDEVVKHTRTAHRPLYGWFVLVALAALLGAVWVGSRIPAMRPGLTPAANKLIAASLAVMLLGCASEDAARVTYNEGVAALAAGKLDEAEAAFTTARSDAGADAELRFNAAFNLAAVAVARAEAAAAATPPKLEEAISQLKAAEGWLYSARSLRPAHAATAENLRAVKTRSIALIEQLNAGKHGLEARLDAAIAAQRGLRDAARELHAHVLTAGTAADPMQLAPEGAKLALSQQALLAEAGVVSDMAASEIESLSQAGGAAGTNGGGEDGGAQAARLAQLQALDQYIALARSAMVDARRLAQQVRTELAASRSADALEHLKRAREQLMDPIAVMQAIAGEQVETLTLTAQKPTGEAPAWATDALLRAQQTQLTSRLRQVQAPLIAAVEAAPSAPTTPASGEEAAQAQARAKLLAKVAKALPHIASALGHMENADVQLAAKAWTAGAAAQELALAELSQAMEQFADARQMIDMAWQSQQMVGQALLAPTVSAQLARHVREAVGRNGARLVMLEALLAELKASELATAAQAPQAAQAAPPTGDDPSAAIEARFAKAETLRLEAAAATAALKSAMARGDKTAQAREATRALTALTELRTLFYTLIEHLKQLAADQAQTRDDTTAAGDALDDRAARLASPLAGQETHQAMADAIATALAEAADAAAGAPPPADASNAGPSAEQLRGAAQEVAIAKARMQTAITTLQAAIGQASVASVDVAPTLQEQATALEHLRKAIEILEPPSQDEPKEQKQDKQAQQPQPQAGQDQPKDQASGQASGAKPDDKKPTQPPTGNALQRAQEREAERRRNQPRARPQPVEKDW
ncbi:MAG: VWA domain-containing protein [Myxococcales bacterium]|nr:VWA domain-containing protein [Myxococcales bacterium]